MKHHRNPFPFQTMLDEYYADTSIHGKDNAAKLGWENSQAQIKRFAILKHFTQLDGCRLLDVGAGLGDLADWLVDEDLLVDYYATELFEAFYHRLCLKHGAEKIFHADVFSNPHIFAPQSMDVVYCAGPFNLQPLGTLAYLKNGFNILAEIASEAVLISLLDHRSPSPEDRYAYFDPQVVCRELARPDFTIDYVDGYLPNDFTLIARRRL